MGVRLSIAGRPNWKFRLERFLKKPCLDAGVISRDDRDLWRRS